MAIMENISIAIEILMNDFPIQERNGQTIFPSPEGGASFVYIGIGDCLFGVEISFDDDVISLRDKLSAGMKELEEKCKAQ